MMIKVAFLLLAPERESESESFVEGSDVGCDPRGLNAQTLRRRWESKLSTIHRGQNVLTPVLQGEAVVTYSVCVYSAHFTFASLRLPCFASDASQIVTTTMKVRRWIFTIYNM